ncbi:uncharacterized protein LOC142796282 [Rhipicephalus microplus]|uniref:uncharacterized protein LOC142796282 n=1 Tax=Rhipicephalus microplus TaxID=6941 RepID=UPI003F6D31BF
MVESLDMCSTLLHQLLGVFTASLQMCWVDLEQKTRSGSSPRNRASTLQAPEALFDRNSKVTVALKTIARSALSVHCAALSSQKTKLTTPEKLHAVYCAYEGHISSMAVTFQIYSGAGASSSISPISTRRS